MTSILGGEIPTNTIRIAEAETANTSEAGHFGLKSKSNRTKKVCYGLVGAAVVMIILGVRVAAGMANKRITPLEWRTSARALRNWIQRSHPLQAHTFQTVLSTT